VTTRTYLSIGDVLSLLRQEFPDITISKIRFLESQGLVNPERSPSGYRKFYEHDVERLRWVLRQQREHFLPLKVIRDRLARNGDLAEYDEDGIGALPEDTEITVDADSTEDTAPSFVRAVDPAALDELDATATNGSYEATEDDDEEWVDHQSESRAGALASTSAPLASRSGAVKTAQVSRREAERRPKEEKAPAGRHARPAEAAAPEPAAKAAAREPAPADEPAPANLTGASLTIDELCAASGLGATEVAALEGFGLIEPLVVGGVLYYDEEGLTVAKLAADFARFGIEPRHLRLFRNAVDRELGLIEQVVTPLLRQRNPEARQRAVDAAGELSRLGQSLRGAILRRSLHQHFGG
jgi:DNA-binding transcriptional MerR regulator